MGGALRRLFRLDLLEVDESAVPADPRDGSRVAIAFPLVAVLLVLGWLVHSSPTPFLSLGVVETMLLAGLASFFGRFQIDLGPRGVFSFERPTVMLAGLLGGPFAGAVVGAAGGSTGPEFVWRRRATYGGLGACEGVVAGLIGIAWQQGEISTAAAVVAGGAAAITVNTLGCGLVQIDRQVLGLRILLRGTVVESAEFLVALPLIMLLAANYGDDRVLVLAVTASGALAIGLATRAIAVQRAEAVAERSARLRDLLTGALSRMAFEEALERETNRVRRGGHAAGLLVIDVDHFKEINDTYRHTGGDAILRQLVTRLVGKARNEDLLARWGGEEFCLLAPSVGTLEAVETLAERLRAATADRPFHLPAGEVGVTVSIGATLLDGAVPTALAFERADEALYRAKRSRDAVCVLPPLQPGQATPGFAADVVAAA